VASGTSDHWLTNWLWRHLLYRVVAGIIIDYLVGCLLAFLLFPLLQKTSFPKAKYAFVSLSITLISYGVTELMYGYGFLAVFVTALTMDSFEGEGMYHHRNA
jgi:sodium/hydrogen antiporter